MAVTTILPAAGAGTLFAGETRRLGSLAPKFSSRPRKLLSCSRLNEHQLLHHTRLLQIPSTNSFNWKPSGSYSHSNYSKQVKDGFLQPLEASKNDDQNNTSTSSDDAFMSQEELSFLLKLGGGSVLGGAIIKYGSILFPEITRPNLVLALTIISTPVVVAVLLLIKQSLVVVED